MGFGDGGRDGQDEWNVVGCRAQPGGKGGIREGRAERIVKEGTVEAAECRGVSRLLDQVNKRSIRGNSFKARASMTPLNLEANLASKLLLFLSKGALVRLKSPMDSQQTD